MKYRVLLVEGNRLMMEQLANVINQTPDFELAAKYQSDSDALGQGGVFKPNLILLDVENRNAPEILADFRRVYPDTSIVCMGDHWQAEVASHLVREGARGYIIKPFTGEYLVKAMQQFAKTGMEVTNRTVSFFSPKGKSGKTTVIANLAMCLANKTGEQIGIIDADLQFGDMAVFFNLKPKSTIVEAVRDVDFLSPISLSGYFTEVNDRVKVLCGTANPSLSDRVEIESFIRVIHMAQSLFRYVLIDVPPGFNPTSIAAAEQSDTVYLVSMINGGFEVQHMRRALEIFEGLDRHEEIVRTIFTRVTPCDIASQKRLEQELGYPVDCIVPNEYQIVSNAADNGRMALDIEPDSQLTRSINKLAAQLTGHKQIRWDQP
ncbi:MinD/ParA family protein [Selenomonas sp. WCA-380-WT-3B 3/]|uniref:MinD/ParA family protein n=1 Tax=Selenomonas montiformis TaxID=2652285 RepID=A0A6I2UZE4_9FIRM|nr:AAA family ATPase [Selenomonas montiformis]MSV24602.1 MinD/ParA family protein [Selenomonas montiformis]